MYENEFPEKNDIVMVLVKQRQEMGAYVHLLEYNNCEGMIMFSELSRRRIRSINKVLGINKQEVAAVVRVDKEKGYIDLSKRRVAPEDVEKIQEKWNKSRAVHSIVRNIAETVQVDMEDLYKRWGWPLYKKYGHAYDAFTRGAKDPDAVFGELDITEKEKEVLLLNIGKRLIPQPIKMRADVEVTCFKYEGIDAIKAALKAGETIGTEDCPIKVKLVAPPLYVVTTTSLQKQEGIALLNNALDAVKSEITKRGGKYTLKTAPQTVSDKDEQLLSSLMARLESENREVAGDEDSEEE